MLDLLIGIITQHGLHTPSKPLVSAQGLFSYELQLYVPTSHMGVKVKVIYRVISGVRIWEDQGVEVISQESRRSK